MLRQMSLRPVARASGHAHCACTARIAARRTFTAKPTRATEDFSLNKLHNKRRDYERNRTAFLSAGAIAGIASFIYTAYKLKVALAAQSDSDKSSSAGSIRLDSPIPTEAFKTEAGEQRKVVLRDDEGHEIVPTGNSVVQTFPRTIDVKLPTDTRAVGSIEAIISSNEGTEYTLVGLGTRTVTFLGIQVYVVGFYVATQDIAKLQTYLVKKVNSLATTLIPSEKESLRKSLLDPAEGEETWDTILRDAGCRSAFRITPVKDTDFGHLRDGFVRAITARSQRDSQKYGDEQFGEALKEFKNLFARGSVPKQKEMLMCRDQLGRLSVLYDEEATKGARSQIMGSVQDERISRLLWLNYLAGNKVASEPARQNIINGVMEFVERPVGTVATQVL
ncbi:Altered inheritance of mitochondria protein-like protein [Emericellopsis cladophorae]|uniref:Altered inheritance of mitochondria protein-like protein n=1 Tax=Emericellopsis cladophorae TaxID=2686198 RepID=A0A9Q0BEE3_9HYPO|nr:Altered inheritance of mitochondria protein-like protein [Emericellopsis cladophorae]KAI6781144.1 Altered inheritance of mitochondria protein-like protein [Emericellopsis cladophorae]